MSQAVRSFPSPVTPLQFENSKGQVIDTNKLVAILNQLQPLSLASEDQKGNRIQLFKTKQICLVAIVATADGHYRVIPQQKIVNPLGVAGGTLAAQLEQQTLRSWDFVFDAAMTHLTIWPKMKAAGFRPGFNEVKRPINERSPIYSMNHQQVVSSLISRGFRPRGPDPANGKGDYLSQCGRWSVHVDLPENNRWKEPPHVDIVRRYSRHSMQALLSKRKALVQRAVANGQEPPKFKQPVLRWAFKGADQNNSSAPLKHASMHHLKSPAKKQFHETLQKTELVKSYNSSHPSHPVPAKGASGGDIGGVGCQVELIQGLFDSAESLFESSHTFFFPYSESDGELFSNDELQQLIRELAIGIYTYDEVPFFSLHFTGELTHFTTGLVNQPGLFPVISPVYENTLVGQVISMLDYIMKGYLNGGVFTEEFVKEWYKNPDWKAQKSLADQHLVDFFDYCDQYLSDDDKLYLSLTGFSGLLDQSFEERVLEEISKKVDPALKNLKGHLDPFKKALEGLEIELDSSLTILNDPTQFSNSFRIIAKQKSFQKIEDLFVLDGDFDVLYTIKPSPEYQHALEIFQKKYGCNPPLYQNMEAAYKNMAAAIHDHMVKLPICQKYFKMLGLISFLSGYFLTLKNYRKEPVLVPIEKKIEAGCPPLFPHLPVHRVSKEIIRIKPKDVLSKLIETYSDDLFNGLKNWRDQTSSEALLNILKELVFQDCLEHCSSPMARYLKIHRDEFESDLGKVAADLFSSAQPLFAKDLRKVEAYPNLSEEVKKKSAKQCWELTLSHIKDKEIDLFKIKRPFINLASEVGEDFLLKSKRVVGGCGMELKPQQLLPSIKGIAVLEEHWREIQQADPETLLKVKDGVLFKIRFQDTPSGLEAPYRAMESLLLPPKNLNQTEGEFDFYRLLKALEDEDEAEFSNLLKQTQDLFDLRDKHGCSILHHAALKSSSNYTKLLLDKGFPAASKDSKGYAPIHYAAAQGCVETVKLLLAQHPDFLEDKCLNGATPLFVAIQNGQQDIAHVLINSGASLKKQLVDGGYTPIHCALHHGEDKIALDIIQSKQCSSDVINRQSEEGVTPLMLAVELGSMKLVEELLKKGADVNLKRKDGLKAIDLAIKKNNLPLVQILLQDSSFSDVSIELAIKKGSLEMVQLLASKPGFFSYKNYFKDSSLILAIRYSNLPAALFILKHIQNPIEFTESNEVGETALSLAATFGLYDLVNLMLEKGAQADRKALLMQLFQAGYHHLLESLFRDSELSQTDLQDLLLVAAEKGDVQLITKLLLPRKVDLDRFEGPKGWKIEHYFAKSDSLILLRQRLIKRKDDLMPLSEEQGKTLAYIAAENGSISVLRYLVEAMKKGRISSHHQYGEKHLFYGVLSSQNLSNINWYIENSGESDCANLVIDTNGMLPAHLAAKMGSKSVLKELVRHKADLNRIDGSGLTPLDYAVRAENKKVVLYLLDQAKVALTPEAIFIAASQANGKLFQLLIKRGADLNTVCSRTGQTALLRAISQHDTRAALLLIYCQASTNIQDKQGWTPLLLASATGQVRLLSLLLTTQGVDKTARKDGQNALHLGCKEQHYTCVLMLLKTGFSPLDRDVQGQTATELARHSLQLQQLFNGVILQPDQVVNAIQALKKDNRKPLSEIIQQFSLDAEIPSLNTSNLEPLKETLLHFLIGQSARNPRLATFLKDLLPRVIFNPEAKDSKGRSYGHRLAKNGQIIPLFSYQHADNQGRTPLHLIVKKEKEATVKQLVSLLKVSDLNAADKWGNTPLLEAIDVGNPAIIQTLLLAGADVNQANHQGVTPLSLACRQGQYLTVRKLIEHGACINPAVTNDQNWPLFASLSGGNDDVTFYLLSKGANYLRIMEDGRSLMHIAAETGKLHLLRFMAAKGVSIEIKTKKGLQPIHFAAQNGKTKTIETLEAMGANIDTPTVVKSSSKEVTPLQMAATRGKSKTVKWLLEHRANPAALETIVSSAVVSNCTNLIDLLKEYETCQDHKHLFPAIQTAVAADYAGMLELLYSLGIPIESELMQGWTGIHQACASGSLQATEFLLNQGAHLDLPSATGETALELAAANSSAHQFRLVLNRSERGIEATNERGETLLHLAAKAGKLLHVMLLVDYGANLDAQDTRGFTPLHNAVKENQFDVAEFLLACRADVSKRSTISSKKAKDFCKTEAMKALFTKFKCIQKAAVAGETPLHFAVRSGHKKAVMVLAHHSTVNQTDSQLATPLKRALELGNPEIIRLLLQHGAKSD